jgi:hypothetical protein
MQRSKAIIGSAIFFVLVPCVFAGVIPWWMTRWRMQPAILGMEWLRVIGVLLVASGVPGLVLFASRCKVLALRPRLHRHNIWW